MKPVTPSPPAAPAPSPEGKDGSPKPFGTRSPAWLRLLFPACLLLVSLGFMAGRQARGRWGMWTLPPLWLGVDSEPAGASVFLNGRLVGATPLKIEGLEPGAYGLRLEKAERLAVTRRITVSRDGMDLFERLPEALVRKLKVDIEPRGAEVLLDGELIGCTPLLWERLPVGLHELAIRKTNFEMQTFRLDVKPEEEVVTFSGFPLRNKILALLRRQVDAAPHRIGHLLDLGHYLFVNGDLEEAAKEYGKALVLSSQPLKLPEPFPAEERDVEVRLRIEDVQRLNDELRKKQNWPGKDVALFRSLIEDAQAQVAKEHVHDWAWVRQAAESLIRDQKLERAEDLYLRHIGAAAQSPELSQALAGLLAVRLRMHNLSGVRETFARIVAAFGRSGEALGQAAQALVAAHTFYRDQERAEILDMAEKVLRAGLEATPAGAARARYAGDLAGVLARQERFEQALLLFQQAIDGAPDERARETGLLCKAACLAQMKSFHEARLAYEQLLKSPRESVVRLAEEGLKALRALESKMEKDGSAKPQGGEPANKTPAIINPTPW